MLTATLSEIRVARSRGRARSRPDRVIADKGYPSMANQAWLRERGIAAKVPERDDQIAHRRCAQARPHGITTPRSGSPPPFTGWARV